MSKIILIDALNVIFRSYYAMVHSAMKNEEGQNVTAVYQFMQLVLKWGQQPCQGFAAAFESEQANFREKLYPLYKANRDSAPQDLSNQVSMIIKLLNLLGVPCFSFSGYEADDVIASLHKSLRNLDNEIIILSQDKDLMQLLDDKTILLRSSFKKGYVEYDEQQLWEQKKIKANQVREYLSLLGDSSDNVPGVSGIGEKTALWCLSQYQDLEDIYAHIDQIPEKVAKKLIQGKESAFFSRKLISLEKDLYPELDIKQLQWDWNKARSNWKEIVEILEKQRMVKLLNRWEQFLWPDSKLKKPKHFQQGEIEHFFQEPLAEVGASSQQNQQSLEPDLFSFSEEIPSDSLSNSTEQSHNQTLVYQSHIVESEQQLQQLAMQIQSCSVIALDCETTGLEVFNSELVGLSLAFEKGHAYYLPLKRSDGQGLLEKDVQNFLKQCIQYTHLLWVAQNSKFDYQMLGYHWDIWIPFGFDTMIAAWILEDSRRYNLEILALEYLQYHCTSYQQMMGQYSDIRQVPLTQLSAYACEDAYLCWQLYHQLQALLEKKHLETLMIEIEMPLMKVLSTMELKGILFNHETIANYQKQVDLIIEQLSAFVFQQAGYRFNLNSNQQIQQLLFEKLQLKTDRKTKTGYSSDAAVLQKLAPQSPVAQALLEYRQWNKLKTAYINNLPDLMDQNHRIHTHFHQTATATGRLSSSSPNLQNIPVADKGVNIRSAFYCDPGFSLVSFDYNQIELVVLAHLSEDQALQQVFIEQEDIHAQTASYLFDIPLEEVTPKQRSIAKVVNFGVIYQMSSFRLSEQLNISRQQAKDFIQQYFLKYPGIQSYIDQIILKAQDQGYVETILGYQRKVDHILSSNKIEQKAAQRIAVNTPVQGSAADIVKLAMIKSSEMLKKQHPQVNLLLQIHDELIFQVPDEDLEPVIDKIIHCMETAYKLNVPLKVSAKVGKNWGTMKAW